MDGIVTKEDFWQIILNDTSQFGQITTEDKDFNEMSSFVWTVVQNTLVDTEDDNYIKSYEDMIGISGEGLTQYQRKVNVLYMLTTKNYLALNLIKRGLINLGVSKFEIEHIKDENKLVVHTDRVDDDAVDAVSVILERVIPKNINIERYNHNIEISWRDINKYAACKSVDEMKAINPEYKTDLTSDGSWIWPLDKLENGDRMLYNATEIKRLKIYAPNCTRGERMINDINIGINQAAAAAVAEFEIYMPSFNASQSVFCSGSQFRKGSFTFSKNVTSLDYVITANRYLEDFWINDLPYLAVVGNAFDRAVLNKSSILRFLGQLPAYTSGTHTGIFGFHVDHQNDEEVQAAIADAEAKGWSLTVQWNGAPTTQAATTYGLRKPPIYAKVAEMELPDGTAEQYLEWGHYVTNPEDYQEFYSLEEAYKHFGLEKPTFEE